MIVATLCQWYHLYNDDDDDGDDVDDYDDDADDDDDIHPSIIIIADFLLLQQEVHAFVIMAGLRFVALADLFAASALEATLEAVVGNIVRISWSSILFILLIDWLICLFVCLFIYLFVYLFIYFECFGYYGNII